MKENLATINQKEDLLQQQNRKSSMWSREKIVQLIELYKKHECLWNHWHESYKSKDKRKRAIEEICSALRVSKFEFGKKIHNLRNQFNTEMKKLEQRIEESGVSVDDASSTELRCKWSHFESLMFLRHVIEPRPGGYHTSLHTPKKMRLKCDFNDSEEGVSVTAMLFNSNDNSDNNTNNVSSPNQEEVTQLQYDDNGPEEMITDDYQAYENDVGQPTSREEIFDRKYQPPQLSNVQALTAVSSCNFILGESNTKSQKAHQSPQPSTTSCSQTEILSINSNTPIIELNSSNVNHVVPSQSHVLTTTTASPSPSITTPVISAISSSTSNRSNTLNFRDQWDAFGELVANEFRNLNSEISRKRLKRKIMQAMLEVGEEDDCLLVNRAKSS